MRERERGWKGGRERDKEKERKREGGGETKRMTTFLIQIL